MSNALKIGGLTRLTTIDYPGELAAVVYCQGCPWRCRYCHNHDLLTANGSTTITWQAVKDFLTKRRGKLDAVVFSGGEPTAQSALYAALDETRALGFKIGLHSGGAYPARLQRLLPLLDWIGLDIKALPEAYRSVTNVPGSGEAAWRSLELVLESGIEYEIRTTPMPDCSATDLAALAQALAQAGVAHYRLQRCLTEHALDPDIGRVNRQDFADLAARSLDHRHFASFALRT